MSMVRPFCYNCLYQSIMIILQGPLRRTQPISGAAGVALSIEPKNGVHVWEELRADVITLLEIYLLSEPGEVGQADGQRPRG